MCVCVCGTCCTQHATKEKTHYFFYFFFFKSNTYALPVRTYGCRIVYSVARFEIHFFVHTGHYYFHIHIHITIIYNTLNIRLTACHRNSVYLLYRDVLSSKYTLTYIIQYTYNNASKHKCILCYRLYPYIYVREFLVFLPVGIHSKIDRLSGIPFILLVLYTYCIVIYYCNG